MKSVASLHAVKTLHTLVWTFFATTIFAIPVLAWTGKLQAAFICIAIVLVEVLVLAFNNWTCPLTGVAARYTDNRRDNFDIYLPEWLARHNKGVFGLFYIFGVVFTLARWGRW